MAGFGVMPPSGRRQIADLLLQPIRSRSLSLDAQTLVRELATSAAIRITDRVTGDPDELVEFIHEGQTAFENLIAHAAKETDSPEVAALNIRKVLEWICPLWPICD